MLADNECKRLKRTKSFLMYCIILEELSPRRVIEESRQDSHRNQIVFTLSLDGSAVQNNNKNSVIYVVEYNKCAKVIYVENNTDVLYFYFFNYFSTIDYRLKSI